MRSKKFSIRIALMFILMATMVLGASLNVFAADYNAELKGNATKTDVQMDKSNTVENDTPVSGTLSYSGKQSDVLEDIIGMFRSVQSWYGNAYTILDNNNYVDITVNLPEGFTGTYSDASTSSLL